MASNIERPTLVQIQQRMQADFRAEVEGSEPTVPLSTEYAHTVASSGASHLKHGRIDYAMRQQFPDTADDEGVFRWASFLNIAIQQPQKSQLTGTAIGTPGSTISIGDTLVFANEDLTYTVLSNATIPAIGQVEIAFEAVNTGANANLADKSLVQFETPPAGVQSDVIVTGVTSPGTDLETADQMLTRILFRIQGGKLVGKPGDWIEWAKSYPGVTRAWEVAMFGGPGTMGVFFVFDNDPVSIFPDAATVALVESHIQALAPTPMTTIGAAPTNSPLDLEIILTPDTADVRNAVELELEDMLLREATANGFTLTLSKITEAISRAPGEDSNVLVSPVADQVYPVGTIPTLGTITWS